MSFGVGVADIIQALHFVQVTHESWKEAPERYHAVKRRLDTLRGPLNRLAALYAESKRRTSRGSQRDLDNILFSIDNTLQTLDRIIDKRSDLRFWDRLRINTHEVNDLSAALDRHVQDLTCLCSALGLEDSRKIQERQETLQQGQRDLKRGQAELLRLVSRLLPPKVPMETIETVAHAVDCIGTSSSFMTDYGDEEDPRVWREFRRKAIAEGVTSRELETYQAPLHDILRSVSARQRDRQRTPSNSRNKLTGTTELAADLRRINHSRTDESLVRSGFDGVPNHRHSSAHSQSFSTIRSWEERTPVMDDGVYDRHTSHERSRRRRRPRRHSHSIESDSRSESVSHQQ
jgi:hypothetical protein